MLDTLLFLHFVGIAIGAGTGIYMLALSRHAAHHLDQAEARTLIPGVARAISGVGSIGLILLILSGIAMVAIMGGGVWSRLFVAKMVLVALIIAFLAVMNYLGRRAQVKGDTSARTLMKRLSALGPLLAGLTILTAVLAFH